MKNLMRFFILVCLIIIVTEAFASEAAKTLIVYDESPASGERLWIPSGWMPDGQGISFNDKYETNCHNGRTCISAGFDFVKNQWGGVYWLPTYSNAPQNHWKGPGVNIDSSLSIRKGDSLKLTFWARGQDGGENLQFKAGGVTDGNDSVSPPVATEWIALTKDWQYYEINLSNQDVTNVVGGFCWVTDLNKNMGRQTITFFLDDIQYEIIPSPCIPIDDTLDLNLTVNYQGIGYSFTLNHYNRLYDPSGLYFKMDIGTFRQAQLEPGNYVMVSDDLTLYLCVDYYGMKYLATLNYYYLSLWDMAGIYWQLDSSSLKKYN